ncbi:MAG: carbonic anhydrase [Acidobacteriota bacterium]
MLRAWRRYGVIAVALALAAAAPSARSQADGVSPSEAIAKLKSGNATFVASPDGPLPITVARRTALAQGQAPFAAVLSCADSRVPPEVIFHVGLGDLFVVRSAGHVADRAILASLEYGADHLHVPLVVVMGHESCGAVKAAAETPPTQSMGPNLDYLLKAIRPAVAAAGARADAAGLRAAILKNVEDTVNDLMDDSAILRHMADSGSLGLVGAYYELSSGRVYFSEPVSVTLQARVGASH